MFLTEIETSEVFEIISQLKPNKSHSYDGVRSTQYFYLNNHYNHFALKNILCLPCLYALQISKPLKHLPINIWSATNTFIWLIPSDITKTTVNEIKNLSKMADISLLQVKIFQELSKILQFPVEFGTPTVLS
jgi:hypothetical protein